MARRARPRAREAESRLQQGREQSRRGSGCRQDAVATAQGEGDRRTSRTGAGAYARATQSARNPRPGFAPSRRPLRESEPSTASIRENPFRSTAARRHRPASVATRIRTSARHRPASSASGWRRYGKLANPASIGMSVPVLANDLARTPVHGTRTSTVLSGSRAFGDRLQVEADLVSRVAPAPTRFSPCGKLPSTGPSAPAGESTDPWRRDTDDAAAFPRHPRAARSCPR